MVSICWSWHSQKAAKTSVELLVTGACDAQSMSSRFPWQLSKVCCSSSMISAEASNSLPDLRKFSFSRQYALQATSRWRAGEHSSLHTVSR
jgi:hypothetical protein